MLRSSSSPKLPPSSTIPPSLLRFLLHILIRFSILALTREVPFKINGYSNRRDRLTNHSLYHSLPPSLPHTHRYTYTLLPSLPPLKERTTSLLEFKTKAGRKRVGSRSPLTHVSTSRSAPPSCTGQGWRAAQTCIRRPMEEGGREGGKEEKETMSKWLHFGGRRPTTQPSFPPSLPPSLPPSVPCRTCSGTPPSAIAGHEGSTRARPYTK